MTVNEIFQMIRDT